jgi:hypothetical protein
VFLNLNQVNGTLTTVLKSENDLVPDSVEQENPSLSTAKLTFRVHIDQGALAPAPQTGVFLEWAIITDPTEIDGEGEEGMDASLTELIPKDLENDGSQSETDDGDDDMMDAGNVEEHGRELDIEVGTTRRLTGPLLKGYEYTKFEPEPYHPSHSDSPGYARLIPNQPKALKALKGLKKILHPIRETGRGHKDPEFDLWCHARLEGMMSMLSMFTNIQSRTYNQWGASACQAAIGMGRGRHCARRLCELNRAFLADKEILPLNPFGDWNESLLVDEYIVNEINVYLLSLGNEITARKLMDFLHGKEIKEKYGIERNISHKTACRYLRVLGYRFQYTPKGQYVDGHERGDVVAYRNKVFLPKWRKFMNRMASWDKDLKEHLPPEDQKRVVVWFHDESIFYAHDRRKKGWFHKDASAKPYTKGEGASLMVADFVSADFGWLTSPDGKWSARRIFKPGKNRDGYFTNAEIMDQAKEATDILREFYSEYDHVLIYDNATTHLKRAEDALSAKSMPKGIPKHGTNWGIEVSMRDPTTGKLVYRPDGTVEKTKIQMGNAQFRNGDPQPLYFPMNHPNIDLRGKFKGMAVILQERGYTNASSKLAQCKGFKCAPMATDCCCRRILYNEPDFADAESLLETMCCGQGVEVVFLPKFHCELNFIEQCWGRAKTVYRTYPPSSKEEDLTRNTLSALASVPLRMMRRFATRSRRFMDAYEKGLNGKQAAWASRKYRGHRVLPNNILDELDKANVI